MFDFIYLKLKRNHDKLAYYYTSLITKYSVVFIAAYFLLNITFIVLLVTFNLEIDLSTQKYSFPKNSEYPALKDEISGLFEQNQSQRHFAQQLVDSGYYIDLIIKSKSNENQNLINQTLLDEYSALFSQIMNLSVEYNNRTYNYIDDLCAKRLNKCSIEGGILNSKAFQEKLLKNQVFYNQYDGRGLYMDHEANDGTSLNFLFGSKSERTEVIDKIGNPNPYFGPFMFLTGVKYARNRFDLMYNTPELAEISKLWLDKFVDFMKYNSSEIIKNIDVAYSTSHHLDKEIEYYSQFDIKYVLISIGLLVFFFFAYFWFDFQTNLKYFIKCIHKREDSNTAIKQLSTFDFYLPFFSIIQILFTITSTVSFLNLCGIVFTPMIVTNLLILLAINLNQTLNIFKMVSTINRKKLSNNKIDIPKRLTFTFQNLLIPQMYSCITIALIYLSFSFTTQFEAIRIYSYFTSKFYFKNF